MPLYRATATTLANLVTADGLTGGFIKDSQAGNLPATATNDNASAGNLGEVISSIIDNGSEAALTSGVSLDVTSISLTAGDWDVWGSVVYLHGATTSVTSYIGWINTTSATIPNGATLAASRFQLNMAAAVPGAIRNVFQLAPARLSLSGTTTVYLSAQGTFTVSTLAAGGKIIARRAR